MALTSIQLRNQAFMEQYTKMNQTGKKSSVTNLHSKNLSEIGTYRPGGFSYVQMDTANVFNYHEPEMSEEEYEQAIIKMAKEDAASDLAKGTDCYDSFRKSKNYSKLQRSFLQCVSPDRIGIVNSTLAKNGGIMKNNRFYNSKGEECVHYNTRENVWLTNVMTSDEKERMKKFTLLYAGTYREEKQKAGENMWSTWELEDDYENMKKQM